MAQAKEIAKETVAACMAKNMSGFDIGYAHPDVSLVKILDMMTEIKIEADKAKAAQVKPVEPKKAA